MLVLLNEKKRFTGTYSIKGSVSGGTVVPSLPPCEDLIKRTFYRWDSHTVQTGVNKIPVMVEVQATDEEGNLLWQDEEKTVPTMVEVQDTNEDGTLKYTEEPIYEEVNDWLFEEADEADYQAYLKEIAREEEMTQTVDEQLMDCRICIAELTNMVCELMEATGTDDTTTIV